MSPVVSSEDLPGGGGGGGGGEEMAAVSGLEA